VESSYSPRTHLCGYSDGRDRVLSDAQLWTELAHHPLIDAEIREDECATPYGNFQHRGGRFCRELERPNQEALPIAGQAKKAAEPVHDEAGRLLLIDGRRTGTTTQFFGGPLLRPSPAYSLSSCDSAVGGSGHSEFARGSS
jgi:hypothetical protein